ncbi:MAG TPA: hypothetical protein V6D00_01680 [Pantanalinema sp.]
MSKQGPPHRHRQTDVLQRSLHTAPLGGGPSAARADAPIRGTDLAEAIAEAEPLFRSLQPRMKAVERALAACPPCEQGLDVVFAGVSAGERNFTLQMTQILANRPEVARKARIVLQQYEVAYRHLQEVQQVHTQFLAAGLAVGRVEGFSLSKFRGALHPLYNFFLVFRGIPHFEPLFPPLEGPATTKPLRPTGVLAPQQATPAEAAPLDKLTQLLKGNPHLASVEPVLQQGIEWLQKAQSATPSLITQAMARLKNRRPSEPTQPSPIEEPQTEAPEPRTEAPEAEAEAPEDLD